MAATTKARTIPRGIRNCNPLNIRIGNVWLGEVDNPTDPHFEQFVNMKYGLRAGFVLLRRYINHYKRKTVPDIINAWAPPSENATTKYIDMVCNTAGIKPDTQLVFTDKVTMVKLVSAMCLVECGQKISEDIIRAAYDLS